METRYYIAKNLEEVKQVILACKTTGYSCVDFETNAEPIWNTDFKPTIISISFQVGSGISIPLCHFETSKYCDNGYSWEEALRLIGRDIIENEKIVKVCWNAKFDLQIFNKYGYYYRGTVIDGMLCKYLLNEVKPHNLKDMVRRYLPEFADYEKQDKFEKIPWDKKELEPLSRYGCQDTDFTLRLTIFFEKKLMDGGLYHILRNLYMPASRVLQEVENNGLYIDRSFNLKLLHEYGPLIEQAKQNILTLPRVIKFQKSYNKKRVNTYLDSIYEELDKLDPEDSKDKRKITTREKKISNIRAGVFTTKKEQELIRPLNLGSNKDLVEVMFSKRGFRFEPKKFTKDAKGRDTDKPSTDEESLEALRLEIQDPSNPKAVFLDNLLKLRGLEKMYKTYILGWNEKIRDDNKLHGRFNLQGTESNRLSSADPNLQQIPKTSVDPNIKKQLVATPGRLYFVMDFSQAELRMMAHLAKDETYLHAFANDLDPHLAIAAKKYGIPYEEALKSYNDENDPDHKTWKVRRKQAKQIAFGLIYGIQAKLLSVKLSDPQAGLIVTPEEAQQMQDEFFEEHPAIRKFMKSQEKKVIRDGYVTSLFGTKRRLPEIYSDNESEAAYAKRIAVNFPCLLPTSQALCKTKGWVNSDNLGVGDEILAFNPKTGKSEWQPVLEVNTPDYDGDLYRFNSKHCGILSTDYHRWYVSSDNSYEENIRKRYDQDRQVEEFNNLRSQIYQLHHNGLSLPEISRTLNISYTKVRNIYSGDTKGPLTTPLIEPFRVMTSKEIYDSEVNCRIPIRAEYINPEPNKEYSNDFIALCGWYLTDASIRYGRVTIMQSDTANPQKVIHIDKLLKSSSLEYTRTVRVTKSSNIVRWTLSKDSSIQFTNLLPNRKLNMEFITSLGPSQLETLLYNMRLGDGYHIFCTGDQEQAELVQAIVVLIGKSSSMYKLSHKGKRSYFKDHKPSKYGQEYVEATKDSWGIKFSDRYMVHTKSYGRKLIDKVKYTGRVWCPTVDSGAFFVRYMGKDGRYRTMITGNCQSPASNMTLFGSILNYWDMKNGRFPSMDEVATVHDAVYYNTLPEDINIYTVYKMWDTFRNPKTKKYFNFQITDVDMSMDFTIGRSMAEELPFVPNYDYRKMLQEDFDIDEYMALSKERKTPIKDFPKVFKKEYERLKKHYEGN